jgi:ABC-type cobalamin transport system ATPase subunit
MVSHLLDDVANHVSRLAIVEREFFQVGAVEEVLTGPNLSTLYGMDVRVQSVDGRTVIIAGGRHGSR